MRNGRVTEWSVVEMENCEHTLTGDYEIWKRIIDGGEDPIQAIVVKKPVFEGKILVVKNYLKAVNLIMESVKRVPTEFCWPEAPMRCLKSRSRKTNSRITRVSRLSRNQRKSPQ